MSEELKNKIAFISDMDGVIYHGNNLLVYSSYWAIEFTNKRNPGLKVSEIVVAEG